MLFYSLPLPGGRISKDALRFSGIPFLQPEFLEPLDRLRFSTSRLAHLIPSSGYKMVQVDPKTLFKSGNYSLRGL